MQTNTLARFERDVSSTVAMKSYISLMMLDNRHRAGTSMRIVDSSGSDSLGPVRQSRRE